MWPNQRRRHMYEKNNRHRSVADITVTQFNYRHGSQHHRGGVGGRAIAHIGAGDGYDARTCRPDDEVLDEYLADMGCDRMFRT